MDDASTPQGHGRGLGSPTSPVKKTTPSGSSGAYPMDLRLEAVEDDDLVAALDQTPDEVGADEAGAAGDERPHRRHWIATPMRDRYWLEG